MNLIKFYNKNNYFENWSKWAILGCFGPFSVVNHRIWTKFDENSPKIDHFWLFWSPRNFKNTPQNCEKPIFGHFKNTELSKAQRWNLEIGRSRLRFNGLVPYYRMVEFVFIRLYNNNCYGRFISGSYRTRWSHPIGEWWFLEKIFLIL